MRSVHDDVDVFSAAKSIVETALGGTGNIRAAEECLDCQWIFQTNWDDKYAIACLSVANHVP